MRPMAVSVALLGLFSPSLFAAGNAIAPYTLAQHEGRSWLITPAGDRFVPLGLNHLTAALSGTTEKLKATRLTQMEQDLRDWHFNTVGYGAPEAMWATFPFVAEVSLTRCGHYLPKEPFAYDDVFDPTFQAEVRRKVAALCARTKNNPNCIGYWWTDTPRWDLEIAQRLWGQTWVSAIRALPDAAPGKRRYAELLRSPGNHDDRAFLRLIARELYSVTALAFREHDPRRLIFGERYKLGDHPPEVLEEAAKVVDIISVQPGPEVGPLAGPGRDEREFDRPRFDALHAQTGKPIVICDHQVSFLDPAQPVTLWHQFPTETEAANCYERFLGDAFTRSYLIGYFRCQYWSQWMPAPRNLLKQGLRRVDGEVYGEIARSVSEANARLLEQFLRKRSQENK